MSLDTPKKEQQGTGEGVEQVEPDSASDTIAARTRSAQVLMSIPIPKIYPPLGYPPMDVDVDNTPPPSPPTCIDTPPLSPTMNGQAAKVTDGNKAEADQSDRATQTGGSTTSFGPKQLTLLRRGTSDDTSIT